MNHASDQSPMPEKPRPVLLAGATGYIGRHVLAELQKQGYPVLCPIRKPKNAAATAALANLQADFPGVVFHPCNLDDTRSLAAILQNPAGHQGEPLSAVISCISARGGGIKDSWQVDHALNEQLLKLAKDAGAEHFILLSAICVQKPLLAFQQAKLAFEESLQASGLRWSIVRPTAFFKSLAGQVRRVQQGKPFLIFGDGNLTACKPIAEEDLARFMVGCLTMPEHHNTILPIGGPGPAVTPREQGQLLFELTGQPAKFKQVPVRLFDVIIATLAGLGRVLPKLRDKAEFARIGRYYATESMLCLDPESGNYDADLTPEFGNTTLREFYARVLEHGLEGQELREQALFD